MTTQTLVWLFIVIFVIHDLEEIIWVEPWIKKNGKQVITKLPAKMQRQMEKMFNITSSQFAIAVLLEFLIFIPFTYVAAEQGKFFIFIAINSLFLLHVFTHVGQSIYLKMYTPGVISAVIFVLPYTLYVFHTLLSKELVTWTEVLYSVPVGFILIPIVLIGHELGRKVVK